MPARSVRCTCNHARRCVWQPEAAHDANLAQVCTTRALHLAWEGEEMGQTPQRVGQATRWPNNNNEQG